jgi:hypothetical protein
MLRPDAKKPRTLVFVTVIFIAVLIDAVLFAHLRVQFVHDRGYDLRPRHPAVAKPAPP